MLRTRTRGSGEVGAVTAKLWTNAFARVAQDRLALAVRLQHETLAEVALADVMAGAGAAMILSLAAADGRRGVAVLSAGAFSALVEMHMLRRLRPTAPPDRSPTRVDAAIVTPMLDEALDLLSVAVAELPDIDWAAGWRVSGFVPEPRPLLLTMPEGGYRALSVTFGFGTVGDRIGDLALVLADKQRPQPLRDDGAPADWPDRLRGVVMEAPSEIRAVLWRLRLPLASAVGLSVGQELRLPAEAIDEVRIEGADRALAAVGRLGQLRGDRAVRVRTLAGTPGNEAIPADTAAMSLPDGDLPLRIDLPTG